MKGKMTSNDRLKELSGLFKKLFDEVTVEMKEDGWYVKQTDRSAVHLIDLKVPTSWFSEYECGEEKVVALKTNLFDSFIKKLKNPPVKIHTEGDKLVIGDQKTEFRQEILESSSEDTPSIDGLEFETTASADVNDLVQAIGNVEVVTDSVKLSVENSELVVQGQDYQRGVKTTIDSEVIEGKKDEISVKLASELLSGFLKAIKKEEKVQLEIGKNIPLKISTDFLDYLVAPRIDEEMEEEEETSQETQETQEETRETEEENTEEEE